MLTPSITLGSSLLLSAVAGRDIHRSVQWLGEQACPSCGAAYGRDAAGKARYEYIVRCDRESRDKPGLQVHFAPEWRVKCQKCAALSDFNFETYRLNAR